jgi:putative ATPase
MNQSLALKYSPRRIADFIGLAAQKAMLSKFAAAPYSSAWLLIGNPGTGKSTLAMVVAETIRTKIGCAIHHLKSAESGVPDIEKLVLDSQMAPMLGGRWHVAVVEEAGSMGPAAQKAWLSVLDPTGMPEDLIILFTANPYVIAANGRVTPHGLKDRFLSRVRTLQFAEPSDEDLAAFLKRVHGLETGKPAKGKPKLPDFTAIAHASRGNIREALNTLEMEILVPGSFVIAPQTAIPFHQNVVSIQQTANGEHPPGCPCKERRCSAKRAWVTMHDPAWVPPAQKRG